MISVCDWGNTLGSAVGLCRCGRPVLLGGKLSADSSADSKDGTAAKQRPAFFITLRGKPVCPAATVGAGSRPANRTATAKL